MQQKKDIIKSAIFASCYGGNTLVDKTCGKTKYETRTVSKNKPQPLICVPLCCEAFTVPWESHTRTGALSLFQDVLFFIPKDPHVKPSANYTGASTLLQATLRKKHIYNFHEMPKELTLKNSFESIMKDWPNRTCGIASIAFVGMWMHVDEHGQKLYSFGEINLYDLHEDIEAYHPSYLRTISANQLSSIFCHDVPSTIYPEINPVIARAYFPIKDFIRSGEDPKQVQHWLDCTARKHPISSKEV